MSKSRQVLGCGTLHHMLRPPRVHRSNIHRAGQHCKVPEDSHSPVSRTNTRYFGGWTEYYGACRRYLPCSVLMHAFWITLSPAFRAFSAAASLLIPSCIQTLFSVPCFFLNSIAWSTTAGTSSEGLKISTTSIDFARVGGMSRSVF